MTNNPLRHRWLYLALGVASMLFAGIIYAWSILKAPFAAFWTAPQLAMNFTITMTCFCLGGFVGAKLCKRFGIRNTLLIAGALSFTGFLRTSPHYPIRTVNFRTGGRLQYDRAQR